MNFSAMDNTSSVYVLTPPSLLPLGLYRDPAAKKQWLAVRNITGKVVLSCGLTSQMNFSAMDKFSSVAFACKPVFDGTPAKDMMTLRIKIRDGVGELVAKLNSLKDGK